MSATATTPAAARVSAGRPGIPFSRLMRVELRKLFDTRAARVLVILMVLGVVAVNVIKVIVDYGDPQRYEAFLSLSYIPLGFLLPVIAIMTATSEWTQRTALNTFMWEPRRGRVLWAKFLSTIIVAVLGYVAVAASSALAMGFAGITGSELDWNVRGAIVSGALIMMIAYCAQGMAFGMAIHNTAGALVLFFILPTVMSLLTVLIPFLGDIREWIDFATSAVPIGNGEFGGDAVAHFVSSAALWILLPAILGVWRTLNKEAK